ncbi:AsmA family protein [Bradyrhizobium sp. NP1]|uniref:AsmA family protein n=1 Tax=Bradyrhizobium sp. NP1 TaxID=3049772 RepID=UPI0025A5A2DF|nr:AsmA family protein [Bradyrhizobium sp. NP1]WJR78702.1 AsmA family protein [Bradyrhizobium sp. NP1]
MRALKIAGTAAAAVLVILVLLLIIGIPSGFLSSAIADRVERATGYRIAIAGATRISLWPSFTVTMGDVTLKDPKERETSSRLSIDSIEAGVALSSLWSGHPEIRELAIRRPVLSVPLLRDRLRDAATSKSTASGAGLDGFAIDRITITDGAVVFSNARDRVENRIDAINAHATLGADRKLAASGNARAGSGALKYDIKAALPASPGERQTVPLEFTLDAPDLLQAPLTGKAEARLSGSVVMINAISGTLGDAAFNGWASVDGASKPLVKLDLDFKKLDVAVSKTPASPINQPWSNAPISLIGLNYVDAQARISAAELNIGDSHFAPAVIDAALAGGVLKTSVSNLGAYGGNVTGEAIIDASRTEPSYAMHADFVGVRALPLLRSLADFDRLDGRMQAKIAVRSNGTSQRAILSNLSGTAFINLQDGAIRGLNVAQMIRSLTTGTLSGWQESREEATDLSQLSASFRIERGQAQTTDLNLVGPLVKVTGAGTVDLGTKLMAFRVEPKLVLTTQGQGRTSDPVAFGIPVMIDGSWSEPRIYPDMQGMLDNPDAAYAKLREMGKGLFGAGGAGLDRLLGGLGGLGGNQSQGGSGTNQGSGSGSDALGTLGGAIGNLIQGLGGSTGSGRDRSIPAPPQGAPPTPQAQPSQPRTDQPAEPPAQQESQPMNDVLRQLFNRQ